MSGVDRRKIEMLTWALFFLVVAIVAGVFGFGGIAGAATFAAQILFFLFLSLFVVALWFDRRLLT
jgi:uncharacterized membrane protein YtjA (UPF0391 family)